MVLGFLRAPVASHSSSIYGISADLKMPSLGLLSWVLQLVNPKSQEHLAVLTEVSGLEIEGIFETM